MKTLTYVDVHTHLDHERFSEDQEAVVKRAEKVGVKYMITSGVNPSTNRVVLSLSKKYGSIKCSFGIYPVDGVANHIDSPNEDFLRHVEVFDVDAELEWIKNHKNECVAIGEAGLDYEIVPELKEKQKEIFQKVIDVAIELNKPLITHTRKAEADAIEMLENSGIKKVYMHCFSGKKSLIKRCVENGFYLSVPANITRLEHFKMLVEIVPLHLLITETDAPYLSPVAGKRNEPKNVSITVKEIAKIKGLSESKVAKQIFNNAKALFSL